MSIRKRFQLLGIVAVLAATLSYYLFGGTPRWGRFPEFSGGELAAIELTDAITREPIGSVTNRQVLEPILQTLRSARSVEQHMCKRHGVILLHVANGKKQEISYMPGHTPFRYEFTTSEGFFAVSRSRFLSSLKNAGIDVDRIPKE